MRIKSPESASRKIATPSIWIYQVLLPAALFQSVSLFNTLISTLFVLYVKSKLLFTVSRYLLALEAASCSVRIGF